ncbi:hypothetical protein MOSE0_G00540 [Monosporozyma servazzii]
MKVSSLLRYGIIAANSFSNAQNSCNINNVLSKCSHWNFDHHQEMLNVYPRYHMEMKNIQYAAAETYDVTIRVYANENIALKYLHSLKIIGVQGPQGTIQLWGANEGVTPQDFVPSDFTSTFKIHANANDNPCNVELPSFQIQYEYDYSDEWAANGWGQTHFDLMVGCGGDNQGNSNFDFPAYVWPKDCDSSCGGDSSSSFLPISTSSETIPSCPSETTKTAPPESATTNPPDSVTSYSSEPATSYPSESVTSYSSESVTSYSSESVTTNPPDSVTSYSSGSVTTNPSDSFTSDSSEPATSYPSESVTSYPSESVTTNPPDSVTSYSSGSVTTNSSDSVTSYSSGSVTTNPSDSVTSDSSEPATSYPSESVTSYSSGSATTNPPESATTNPPDSATTNPPDSVTSYSSESVTSYSYEPATSNPPEFASPNSSGSVISVKSSTDEVSSTTATLFTVITQGCNSTSCKPGTTVYTTVGSFTISRYTTLCSVDSKGKHCPPYSTTVVATIPVIPVITPLLISSNKVTVITAITSTKPNSKSGQPISPVMTKTGNTVTHSTSTVVHVPTQEKSASRNKTSTEAVGPTPEHHVPITAGINTQFEGAACNFKGSMIMILISMLLLF